MAKQIERFEDWGYQVNPDSKGFLSHRYIDFVKWTDIHHSGTGRNPDVPINTFGVKDGHRNMLLIPRAYNNSPDHDPRPKSQKLPLRAQIVSYWALVGQRDLRELDRIVYAYVIEQTVKGIIEDVYQRMGAPTDKDLLIARDDPPFDTLLTRTSFGAGVQKILGEYADLFANKRIKSFYFHLAGGTDVFDFIIDLT
jgi:hypothetical protein